MASPSHSRAYAAAAAGAATLAAVAALVAGCGGKAAAGPPLAGAAATRAITPAATAPAAATTSAQTAPGDPTTSLQAAAGDPTATASAPATSTPPAAAVRPATLGSLGFTVAARGAQGGTIWTGPIPDPEVRDERRNSAVYLPPGYDPAHQRYPVVYLLHGLPGSPNGFIHSLDLAGAADRLIAAHAVPPFLAVMPVGGPTLHPGRSEWAGPWETFVVRDVVPWADAHLATDPTPAARALAGLSAGGFGAVDIGLRHPGVFGTLESWNGYFRPFKDGPYSDASPGELAASTPTLLVRTLHPAGAARARFFLSTGPRHGEVDPKWTLDFAHELASLHLPHQLWVLPPQRARGFYRAQLAAALTYALEPARDEAQTPRAAQATRPATRAR